MTDKQPEALRLADHNADLIQRLRRTPMPLADLIPHLQAMGDEMRRLREYAKQTAEGARRAEELATLKALVTEAQDMAIELSGENKKLQDEINSFNHLMSIERMAQETLQAEIERLNKALTYEQHRAERIGTHGPGCEMWGPQHYECAARKLKEQQDAMARVLKARDRYGWSVEADVEIEAMREQLNRES